MNRLHSLALGVVWVTLISCFAVNRTQAQAAPAAPPQAQAQKPATPPADKDAVATTTIHSLHSRRQLCRRAWWDRMRTIRGPS